MVAKLEERVALKRNNNGRDQPLESPPQNGVKLNDGDGDGDGAADLDPPFSERE